MNYDGRVTIETGDDLLTYLHSIPSSARTIAHLMPFTGKVLREAADLCGVDSVEMTKREAITAILENF